MPSKEIKAEPEDKIVFKGDPASEIQSELKLSKKDGGEAKKVAYKVKCSDNDLFKIRPVMGIMKEGETVTVAITFKAKDKTFPAKGVSHISIYEFVPKEDQTSARKIWETPEAKKKQRSLKISAEFADGEKKDEEGGEKKEEEGGEKKEEEKEEKKEDGGGAEEKKEEDKQEE